jgi:glycosyltransferase involved in cell wall biosynthesis
MNKIWGITMVKDEGDIIYNSLLNMVEEGVDGIIVADNLSNDNTKEEIVRLTKDVQHTCPIVLIDDYEVGYWQSQKMTALANKAKNEFGADWIIPFDSDELWYSKEDKLSKILNSIDQSIDMVHVPMINHFRTSLDADTGNPFVDMLFTEKNYNALPKVAIKWDEKYTIAQGNHNVISPATLTTITNTIYIRHFPYRSWDHFYKKAKNGAAAYAATNLPKDTGGHWRNYWNLIETQGIEKVRAEVWEKYFWFYNPHENNLIYNPAPFRRWAK